MEENKNKVQIKVLIVQADDRPELDYVCLSRLTNDKQLTFLLDQQQKYNNILFDISNQFMRPYYLSNDETKKLHPATAKIPFMRDLLQTNTTHDYVIFLDSDAWIQTVEYLYELILYLHYQPDKYGCYSRDPYMKRNTYINSGSFILKICPYTRILYNEIYKELEENPEHHYKLYYDQNYISNVIYRHKDNFIIFKPRVINTPEGIILRHNWWKNHAMYESMYQIVDSYFLKTHKPPESSFNFNRELDNQPYPVEIEEAYEYR
jgi:hypothetical protein